MSDDIKINKSITLVGGVLEAETQLCTNDMLSVRVAVSVLATCGFPLAPEVEAYRNYGFKVDKNTLDVMNLQEGGYHGKRDFLDETIATDILIMANVAYKDSVHGNFLGGLNHNVVSLRETFQLKDAMTVSPQNANDDLWRQKISDSKARIVVVVGESDFPPEKIAGDDYIVLSNMVGGIVGFAVRRDYLREIEPYLKARKSPLCDVALISRNYSDVVEFYRDNSYFGTDIRLKPMLPLLRDKRIPDISNEKPTSPRFF